MISSSRRAATSSSPALLLGESGVGKSLLAEFIHVLSDRRERNFVAVNCAAIPASLIENEMFGHAQGAFSGADHEEPGFFEIASGGTLFLDEVGDLALDLQPKLLHAVETGLFHRVGEPGEPRRANVRILSATNDDIKKRVAGGRFRKDLFYRLSVMTVDLPPLRERKDDIPVLVDAFLEGLTKKEPWRLSGEAMARLLAYDWPGNIRELHNAIQHAVAGAEGSVVNAAAIPSWVREADLKDGTREGAQEEEADLNLREMEIRLILRALRESEFNQTHAARRLGISRRTLHYRIRKYGLQSRISTLEPTQIELDL